MQTGVHMVSMIIQRNRAGDGIMTIIDSMGTEGEQIRKDVTMTGTLIVIVNNRDMMKGMMAV